MFKSEIEGIKVAGVGLAVLQFGSVGMQVTFLLGIGLAMLMRRSDRAAGWGL